MKIIALVLAAILATGCSVNMGIGFRKTPWVVEAKVPPETETRLKAVVMGLTPDQIAIFNSILKLLGGIDWVDLAPYALRENEQATFGLWYDGEIY